MKILAISLMFVRTVIKFRRQSFLYSHYNWTVSNMIEASSYATFKRMTEPKATWPAAPIFLPDYTRGVLSRQS